MERSGEKWESLDGFTGLYSHTLDEKGRLLIPSPLRRGLGKEVVTVRIYPNSLWIFPDRHWRATVEEKLSKIRITDQSALEFSRLIHALAERSTVDKSGRIGVSPRLREWASLEREVVIVGHGRWLEVWDKKIWEAAYTREKFSDPQVLKNWEQLFF